MNILTLQITRPNLDKILDGSKKDEEREITPKTAKRYIKYINEGEDDEDFEILQYDALQLLNGYQSNRPRVVVEVKGARVEIVTNPDTGEDVVFTENGVEYVLAVMIYKLGKVLERENI